MNHITLFSYVRDQIQRYDTDHKQTFNFVHIIEGRLKIPWIISITTLFAENYVNNCFSLRAHVYYILMAAPFQ